MNLPFLGKKQEQKEYFLALIFSLGEIRSILFEKAGQSLLILGTRREEFSEPLDLLSSERVIELSDIVISDVEQKVPEGAVLEKTIFAVPHRWVSEGRIIKENLVKLKALCDALKLVPVGFIVSIEALIAYLHKKEGIASTAIFVELGKKHVTVSLVKAGTILSVSEEEIEKDPVLSLEKILVSQEVMEVLPAKIVLLNYEHAKKIQQTFLSHSWPKSIAFLHIPQVEVLDPESESQAVISGVAAQMGFATIPEIDLKKMGEKSAPVEVAENPETFEKPDNLEEPEVKNDRDKSPAFDGEAVGFFEGIDVLKQGKEKKEEAQDVPVIVAKKDEEVRMDTEMPDPTTHTQKTEATHAFPSSHFPKPTFPTFSFHLPRIFKGRSTFLYPVMAVILFVVLLGGYYYLFEKAQVVVILNKKDVNRDLSVIFSKDKDTSGGIVHVSVLSANASGKEEISTSGTKETGDKAKGEVTIYNKTDSSKAFSKGDIIIGPNNLEFDLNDNVSVASTSSFSTSFSTSNAKITADSFGKEYNLPSGTNFQFKGLSTDSYFAKNSSAFSGGTKKEIKIVSSEDISSLTSKIVNSLMKKAIVDAAGKKADDEKVLSVPLDYTFNQKNFSGKAGDQADSVNVSADISYKLGVYKKQDIAKLAKAETKNGIPSGYQYSNTESTFQIQDIARDKNGAVSGKLTFSAVYLPQFTEGAIAGKIAGKTTQKADQIIQTSGVSDDQITFLRSLSFFPKILPLNKNNIIVKVKTQ